MDPAHRVWFHGLMPARNFSHLPERKVPGIGFDGGRRRFLGKTAMTIAAAHLGISASTEGDDRLPRELRAIAGATEWINSSRLDAESFRGRVIAVDFWTYTCINWLRTLLYVRAWSQRYQQGLVVIGVHTPEFPFERDLDNVRRAVQQMKVPYPVVIDNDYSIWRAFKNTASEQRLCQLIRQRAPIVDRTFAIEFLEPGVEAFSFTFG